MKNPGINQLQIAFGELETLVYKANSGFSVPRRCTLSSLRLSLRRGYCTQGKWRLAPAYDVCWSYNPGGKWTNAHQMTINGKRDNFKEKDIIDFAEVQNIKKPKKIIEQIIESVSKWPSLAREYEIEAERIDFIRKSHRFIT
ncbi:MAG: HipA domain-containing protein [Bacteroidales bacterium]|nr:HipA domain-containing protein [Bacteroidales bacterium]